MTREHPLRHTVLGLLVGLVSFTSFSCSGEDPIRPIPYSQFGSLVAKPVSGFYPLEQGWRWKYLRTFTVFDPENGPIDYVATDTSFVWTMGKVDLGLMTTHGIAGRTVEVTPGGTQEFYQEVFYIQDRKTLTEVASRGSGIFVTPAPDIGDASGTKYHVGGRILGSLDDVHRVLRFVPDGVPWELKEGQQRHGDPWSVSQEDIYFRTDPRVVLVYPLRIGQFWVSFEDPFFQDREVIGRRSVHLPAGHFAAAEIRTRLPDFDAEFTDWVSPAGIVARDFRGLILVTGPGGPAVLDTLAFIDRTEILDLERPRGWRSRIRAEFGP